MRFNAISMYRLGTGGSFLNLAAPSTREIRDLPTNMNASMNASSSGVILPASYHKLKTTSSPRFRQKLFFLLAADLQNILIYF